MDRLHLRGRCDRCGAVTPLAFMKGGKCNPPCDASQVRSNTASLAHVENESKPHTVYRFYDEAGTLLYVGATCNFAGRMGGHKNSKRWFPMIARVELKHYANRPDALEAERQAIQTENPVWNVYKRTRAE